MSKLLAMISHYSGMNAIFYFLNRKAKRILTFHNVLPGELWQANLANGVSCSLDDFKAIVSECARRFRFSTDLFDPKTLTITFDDGYHNQYEYAFKTLREMGIPACLFVSGDIRTAPSELPSLPTFKTSSTSLLIDMLLHWVSLAPLELIPDGDRLQYWVKEIWPRFSAEGDTRGSELFQELDAKYPYAKIEAQLSDEYKRERLSGISPSELDEMRAAGWKIGWHAKSHYPLIRLSAGQLRDELNGPAAFRDVCLSYPYGNSVEVGEQAIRLAEELGYPCAVSNTNTERLNKTSKCFLPRMALGSAAGCEINFVLSGAKYFLKHRRLLPRIPPPTSNLPPRY